MTRDEILAEIDESKTAAGGYSFTDDKLIRWGVISKKGDNPPRGWRRRIEGKAEPPTNAEIADFARQRLDCMDCPAMPGEPCQFGNRTPRNWLHRSRWVRGAMEMKR